MTERQAAEPANDDDALPAPEEAVAAAVDEAPTEETAANDDAGVEGDAPENVEPDDAEAVSEGEGDDESDDDDDGDDNKAHPVDAETWQSSMRMVEALVFASAEPVTERLLANRLPEGSDVKGLLKALQNLYADRGVNLVRAGGSWAFRTAPDLAEILNKEIEVARKMSRAAIETLAIVAYHQPVTRAEIEEIRGVSISKGTIDVLLEEEWIKPRGRRQTPGRPLQWGTTDRFLDHFGLETVRDLPGLDELKSAGLLDASPAINAYRATAGIMEELPQEEPEDGEEGEEEDLLPEDLADLVEEEEEEPLNPDGIEQ